MVRTPHAFFAHTLRASSLLAYAQGPRPGPGRPTYTSTAHLPIVPVIVQTDTLFPLSPSLDHGRDLGLTEPQSIIFGKLKTKKTKTVKAEYLNINAWATTIRKTSHMQTIFLGGRTALQSSQRQYPLFKGHSMTF